MKIQFTIYFSILFTVSLTAQIVLGNGAKINLSGGTLINPIFMVLTPPVSNPIKTSGVTDGIILEDEYNRLQYNLATATTAITIPYMSAALEQIPLIVTPNIAGIGAGNIRFSAKVATTRATGWDNSLFQPSDVTNMGSMVLTNNSAKTIDRFWIIDANGYGTKPSVTLDITYLDAEWATNGGNTISETNLRAQRFNTTINDWDYYNFTPAGTINTVTNKVSNINVPAADFFRSWTLNDKNFVLPIELINYHATCVTNDIVLEWCTSSEKNNDYFTVEQSVNGVDFTAIGRVFGNGTTETKHCYQFIARSVSDMNYFKLTQTDFNEMNESFKIISMASCNQTYGGILIANNGTRSVGIIINSSDDQTLELKVHNTFGQLIDIKGLKVDKGDNSIFMDLNAVSIGVYYVSVFKESEKLISKKVLITDIDK